MKLGIALSPAALLTYDAFKNGGATGAAARLSAMFSGINPLDIEGSKQGAYLNWLFAGYGPLLAAWLFGKIGSRVIR